jgi:hypothetical protein
MCERSLRHAFGALDPLQEASSGTLLAGHRGKCARRVTFEAAAAPTNPLVPSASASGTDFQAAGEMTYSRPPNSPANAILAPELSGKSPACADAIRDEPLRRQHLGETRAQT